MIKLATCSYQEFQSSMGVPIQSSNGRPKFRLPYALGPAWESTMPYRWSLGVQDQDRFRDLYRERLESVGILMLRRELAIIMERYPEQTAVVCCFEVLSRGRWCHRTLFAEWWAEKTGEEVPELGSAYKPPEPPPPALF